MKTFDIIRDFTYIGNNVIVDGESFVIATALPTKSSQSDVELYAVQFHRDRPMLEETAIGMITVETTVYQQALTAWNTAKDLQDNPVYTDAEQFVIDTNNWKASRDLFVSNIEVNHNGVLFQGDEISQGRMARTIVALPTDEALIPWVAKDNSVHDLTRIDLKAILLSAGTAQSNIWNTARPVA